MARMGAVRRKKGKRRPKSHHRMDPTAANSLLMSSTEELAKDELRIRARQDLLAEQAATIQANRARRARRPWDTPIQETL